MLGQLPFATDVGLHRCSQVCGGIFLPATAGNADLGCSAHHYNVRPLLLRSSRSVLSTRRANANDADIGMSEQLVLPFTWYHFMSIIKKCLRGLHEISLSVGAMVLAPSPSRGNARPPRAQFPDFINLACCVSSSLFALTFDCPSRNLTFGRCGLHCLSVIRL